MASKIFISYRRDDAKAEARSIYQHLARIYGRDQIFMDVDSIQKGLDFTKVLSRSLTETSVMLVVMGRTWLSQQDDSGRRRLDDPADYVRLEIATALERDIAVIPVRVDGARLPHSDELPGVLQSLVRRQGTVITHENFDSDVRGLEQDLRKLIPPMEKSAAPRIGLIAGIGCAALVLAGGAWWGLSRFATPSPGPATTAAAPPSQREAEVRRQVEKVMQDDARQAVEAERIAAEAAARRQAEEDAKRRIDRARLEAEAAALRQAREQEERKRAEASAKAEEEKRKANETARVREKETTTAWAKAEAENDLAGYLSYLRSFPDAPNRKQARSKAEPLLVRHVNDEIDRLITRLRRPDGTPSYFMVYPDNPRAVAMCIDWRASAPERIWIASRGAAGSTTPSTNRDIQQQAMGICQNGRPTDSNCTCEIVRHNKENTLNIPASWLSRQLD